MLFARTVTRDLCRKHEMCFNHHDAIIVSLSWFVLFKRGRKSRLNFVMSLNIKRSWFEMRSKPVN